MYYALPKPPAPQPNMQLTQREFPCELDWVEAQVRNAATRAGYEKWWHAEDVARTVDRYWRDHLQSETLSLPAISQLLQTTLHLMGFPDIASKIELQIPFSDISFDTLVCDIPTGFELSLFKKLDATMDRALDQAPAGIRLRHLRSGIKALTGAKRWRKDCDQLHREIVRYLQERLLRANRSTLLAIELN